MWLNTKKNENENVITDVITEFESSQTDAEISTANTYNTHEKNIYKI